MPSVRQRLLCVILLLAAAVPIAPARADNIASPEEIRALRRKLEAAPPTPDRYAAKPYPGAAFDADCSARATAPRGADSAVYCFYTRDPVDRVRAYVKGEGRPSNGVRADVDEQAVSVDGIVKIPKVTMITYWTWRSVMAYHERFPAAPPPVAELIAPLPADARYDKECSAGKSLEAGRNPTRWRQVWCYTVAAPPDTVRQMFDSDYRFTRKRGVQVEVVEVSGAPPQTQVQYWLTTAPPEAAAPAAPTPPAAGAPSGSQPAAAPGAPATDPTATATAPAAPSAPAATPSAPPPPVRSDTSTTDAASQAMDAVNRLRGLLRR